MALGRMQRVAGAVMPVIDDVDHARQAAKRGKRNQHAQRQRAIAPALAEQQAGKHERIFYPLVRPHQADQRQCA